MPTTPEQPSRVRTAVVDVSATLPQRRADGALTSLYFFEAMRWIDGTPLMNHIEPYRRRLFTEALDTVEANGRMRYNLILCGRAKKNWKSADLALAALMAVITPSPHGNQVYLLANDEDQAGDDLTLLKKIVEANPALKERLVLKRDIIERRDHRGFIEVLPAGDVKGSHGKTYRLAAFDEIHGYRDWDLFEALALDPSRPDAQMWITSYASIYHRPGVPLFDLMQIGRAGADPRMLFSWYAADYTTDPDFAGASPEDRANPSRLSWGNSEYLPQQQQRLPSHRYRRLHLNLGGSPDGSAYQAEMVMDAVERGVAVRTPEPDVVYHAFVDMSGGSNDDACLGIAHVDADGRAVLDVVMNQGPPPPFDPRAAVERFVRTLRQYHVTTVVGDKYAGETFIADFARHGVSYTVAGVPKSTIYESLEPAVNGRRVVLLDVPLLEQQLLGLVWKAGKIDHSAGEHDDHSNAAAGALVLALDSLQAVDVDTSPDAEELAQLRSLARYMGGDVISDIVGHDEAFAS